MTRDWLPQYTDLEILVVRKIFEEKTNFIIGHEIEKSPKSVNIIVLSIFKKMGIRTGLASKNLILYNFGTRHREHLEKIKAFVMPEAMPKLPQYVKNKDRQNTESIAKISYILKHGGYAIYDNQKIIYTHDQLLSMNFGFLNKIYDRTAKEVYAKWMDEKNIKDMTVSFPVLSVGVGQFNGISYEPNFTIDLKRILLLFPKSQHKWIFNEEGKSE